MNQVMNKVCSPSYPPVSEDRYNRNVWDDLAYAVTLLKNLDEELKKLHPDVMYRAKQLMM